MEHTGQAATPIQKIPKRRPVAALQMRTLLNQAIPDGYPLVIPLEVERQAMPSPGED